MMRMMNSERHKQLLIDKNVIFHIGSGYYFVVRDLTEFGLLTTNLSEEYETVDMALEEYIIMRRNFNKKFREFRHRIMLLDIVATRPVFYERKINFLIVFVQKAKEVKLLALTMVVLILVMKQKIIGLIIESIF